MGKESGVEVKGDGEKGNDDEREMESEIWACPLCFCWHLRARVISSCAWTS
eukprot:TRINITY_DN611_c0_g1_i3.p5 TRINITY_DN611_c0_g1~~TRINITY_DN611_c0_g1_i3.p5  ORF type:complete len:51 (+),score=7.02 TRINITY_DN611_c0_g1_i3:208-360(+)